MPRDQSLRAESQSTQSSVPAFSADKPCSCKHAFVSGAMAHHGRPLRPEAHIILGVSPFADHKD